jgi:hypothetical protein
VLIGTLAVLFGCTLKELAPNFRASGPDIVYDSSVTAMKGWTSPTFDDKAWPACVAKGSSGDAPWDTLIERSIPLFTRSALRQYESLRVETDPDDGDGFLKVVGADITIRDIHVPQKARLSQIPARARRHAWSALFASRAFGLPPTPPRV